MNFVLYVGYTYLSIFLGFVFVSLKRENSGVFWRWQWLTENKKKTEKVFHILSQNIKPGYRLSWK